MFSISLGEEEPGEEGERHFIGEITLGKFHERFHACSCYWRKPEYEAHWFEAAERLMSGKGASSAFITSMDDPGKCDHIVWWPAWREEDNVVFRNQLVFLDELKSPFDPKASFAHLPPRRYPDEDEKPSEWTVSLQDVREFHAALSRRKWK
jgi:hypothetical protein